MTHRLRTSAVRVAMCGMLDVWIWRQVLAWTWYSRLGLGIQGWVLKPASGYYHGSYILTVLCKNSDTAKQGSPYLSAH